MSIANNDIKTKDKKGKMFNSPIPMKAMKGIKAKQVPVKRAIKVPVTTKPTVTAPNKNM